MDEQSSERSGQEGCEKAYRELEEKTALGDIAVAIGMTPQGGMLELHLSDASLVKFGEHWAYKGRSNDGRLLVRFVNSSLGYAEQNAVSIVRNLPRQ